MVGIIPTEPEQPLVAETRCCKKCNTAKSVEEFYVKNKKTGLLHHMCKRCCIEREQERAKNGTAWGCKPENKEKKKARWREKYWEDPEKYRAIGLRTYNRRKPAARAKAKDRYYQNQDAEIARSAKWNAENPEKVKAWVAANRPRVRAAAKKHRLLHPETAAESRALRRARKMGVKCERITSGMIDRLLSAQKGRCIYCPADLNTVPFHKDHMIPLARGGEHTEANHQLLCGPCNLRKHAKHPLDFAAEMGIVQNPIYIPI